MNYLPGMPYIKNGTNLWVALPVCIYVAVIVVALPQYLNWQSPVFMLGLAGLFFVSEVNRQEKGSVRFAYAAILLSLASVLLPVKTVLYFTLVFALFCTVDVFIGKINSLPLLMAGLISPVFEYTANVFTFPIRLQLTQWAGYILHMGGVASTVEGNVIVCKGKEFSVDPACMGLQMMVTSLLAGILLIYFYHRKFRVRPGMWPVIAVLTIITALNILSNLFRIVCLVQFGVLPGTAMHELTGIICLLVYVVFPAGVIARWMALRFGKKQQKQAVTIAFSPAGNICFQALVAGCILFSAYTVVNHDKQKNAMASDVPVVKGYKAERIDANIVKLENETSLVYIKKISGFYNTEHNPMICWRGSGYMFKQIKEEVLHGTSVYSGVLQKGNDKLYTVWWYDNGRRLTINQFAWRWDMLKGSRNYSIVNVTSSARQELESEVCKIQEGNRFSQLLQ